MPKDQGSGRHSELSPSDSVSTEATEADMPTPRRLCFCPDEPLGLEEASSAECGLAMGFPLMTPSPQYEVPCYGMRGPVADALWRTVGAPSSEATRFGQEGGSSSATEGMRGAAVSSAVAGGEAQL